MSCKRKRQKQKVQENFQDMSLAPEIPIGNANHQEIPIGHISSTESGSFIEDPYRSHVLYDMPYDNDNMMSYSNNDIIIIYEDDYLRRTLKRRLCTGSNFSKIPIISETPKINNPAAWVSSKTQKDSKPIKN